MKPGPTPPANRLFEQAVGCHRAGQWPQAEALYRQVLAEQPRHAEAMALLGVLAVGAGQPGAGLVLIEQACTLRPGDAELLGHRAAALKASGRLPEAIATLQAALRARPGAFALLYNLANAEREAGNLPQAAAAMRRALKREPGNANAHNNLGTILRQQGLYHEAVGCFRRAVALQPGVAPLHFNLGAALDLAGQTGQASESLRTATRLAPYSAEAWHLLGTLLGRLNRHGEAIAAYRVALGLADTSALRRDLARALATAGLRDEAAGHLQAAVALAPQDADALTDLGMLLRDVSDDAGAVAALEAARLLDPTHARAKYHLGLTHLVAGRLSEGWPLYEYRLPAMTGAASRFAAPVWRGGAIAGETLLLHAEQGLGDTLQFCRFVPQAAAVSGARLVLEVQAPLVNLLAGLPGVSAVLPAGAKLPAFACHCPLPSLPIALAVTLDTLPMAPVPYLHAPAERQAAWRERVSALPGLAVGLVWAGNAEYEHDDLRSLPPESLAPLGGLQGLTFLSLQKERGGMPPPVTIDWTGELHDVAETAALMMALDLVISADTAMVHLAGALGCPVWLLNRFDTDWRWMRDRSADSPWYPTLRQFRQPRRGDWAAVIAAVRSALLDLQAARQG